MKEDGIYISRIHSSNDAYGPPKGIIDAIVDGKIQYVATAPLCRLRRYQVITNILAL